MKNKKSQRTKGKKNQAGSSPDLSKRIFPPGDPRAPFHGPAEPKKVCFLIDEDSFGEGYLINSRASALQWFAAFLDNLEDGCDSEIVRVKRKDMTEAEIEACPEI